MQYRRGYSLETREVSCAPLRCDWRGRERGHSTTISVANGFLSPSLDTVTAGQVTFSRVTPSDGHTINWDSGPSTPPNSAGIMTSGTFVVTLKAGTYTYHCTVPGGAVSGTIIVH